jgi:steroid delta-isomerase-like uncharacterized protein
MLFSRKEYHLQVDDRQILVMRWVEAFNAHNVASIVALYANDAELFDAGMQHPQHGHAEIERWFARRFASIPALSYTPADQLFTSDGVVVLWTVRGRSPRIVGLSWLLRSFHVDGVSIFTITDRLIQKQHGYYDHLSALEQILPPLRWLPFRL